MSVTAPTSTNNISPTISNSTNNFTVSGTASDASGLRSVTVNGVNATFSGNAWNKAITVSGTSTTNVIVVATDNAGHTSTITRYVRGAYDVFKVVKETLGQESGEIVDWHSGLYSVIDDTITCYTDSDRIICNRSGKLYIYLSCRNSTGASLQSNCSLYKNGQKVGGVTLETNSTNTYTVTINVNKGDYLQIKNDGGNGYTYVCAGAYFRWVG